MSPLRCIRGSSVQLLSTNRIRYRFTPATELHTDLKGDYDREVRASNEGKEEEEKVAVVVVQTIHLA